MICINCGYNNKDDAKFCIKCGSKIVPLSGTGSFGGAAEGSGKIYCTYCGTENRSSYRFCKHCGRELYKGEVKIFEGDDPEAGVSPAEVFSGWSSSDELPGDRIFQPFSGNSGVEKADLLLGDDEERTIMIETPETGDGSEGGPHLRLSSLADVGTTFEAELSGPVKIGRSNLRNNQIILSDPSVSREHCVVALRDGILYVKDLESVNHTYVNEKEVTGETPLPEGSTLRLGNSAFLVDIIAEQYS